MSIEVKNLYKRFNNFTALDDVSLKIEPGELVALLGPSGSGKTTLLRVIAGLESADAGMVTLEGKNFASTHVRERHVGFVFQHYALFKHMTVFENVAFGLKVRSKATRPSPPVIRRKVMELLSLVHLAQFHDRYPAQLSGGQRQRVALARALAVEPTLLLLDEPFGALDAKVRKELRRWMRHLHDDIHITSIFVTHDQEEAMEVADRVVVMNRGRIEQVGTPEEVYHQPANGFIYDFLGNYNEFDGWRDESGAVHLAEYDTVESRPAEGVAKNEQPSRYASVRRFFGRFLGAKEPSVPSVQAAKHRLRAGEGRPVKLFARPHEMFVSRTREGGQEYIAAKVLHLNAAGPLVKIELERTGGGSFIQAEIPKQVVDQLAIRKHDELFIRPRNTRVFE